ncbi:hypothetical protein BGW37DRAFT_520805 [Umbelopsis sp. PMI_123]|nr:hypothetical protein BGW37DRAFT_520805 [Umbelopsis sp. PMI_123]
MDQGLNSLASAMFVAHLLTRLVTALVFTAKEARTSLYYYNMRSWPDAAIP